MSVSKDQILDAIAEMSVMEVVELDEDWKSTRLTPVTSRSRMPSSA